ncbi:MAG: DUF4252 domain-containing protein [Cyclobacteriaceae bacterium]
MSSRILIGLVLASCFISLKGQEQPLKDFAEDRRERKLVFYASTLRMVNLSENQDFNEMVKGVDKLLIYSLDSATRSSKSYIQISEDYKQEGFDEYASARGGRYTLSLMGNLENDEHEYVGYVGQGDNVFAFYLKGSVDWQKIPELIRNINKEDFLDLNNFLNR